MHKSPGAMSHAEDRIVDDAVRRRGALPPNQPDAVQKKTVSREASVVPGKSLARSPHPKAWDASFVKVPAPTLDEVSSFHASASRDRAKRVSRERHAHMEARAELLTLIAEAAVDADVLGEAFSGKEGDGPGPGASVRVALPPPRLAMREIKERRERERAVETDRARRVAALQKLRERQRESASALRASASADPAAASTSAAEKKSASSAKAVGEESEKTNEKTNETLDGAGREDAARRAELRAFIAKSKARWRVKLAQEKSSARLRERRRLETLKRERATARRAAREAAAAREVKGDASAALPLRKPGWDATPAEETANADAASAPPTPARKVSAAPAPATSARARVFSGSASSASRQNARGQTRPSLFVNASEGRSATRASADVKKRWMEDEARARSAREAASGSSLGWSAFVDTARGARVAEQRRLRGAEARERLRAEVEARLDAAKRAARAAAAERARTEVETAAATRGSAPARASGAEAAASAVAQPSGRSDGFVWRARASSTGPTAAGPAAGTAPIPSPAKSALKKTTPTKSRDARGDDASAELPSAASAPARRISFAATVRESDGAEKPMESPVDVESAEGAGSPPPSIAKETRGVETEGVETEAEHAEESDELRSRPRLLERMRGPPSTRTTLPGDEHVPRAEDWLGMGKGGSAGRIARRLAKYRAPRDPDAPPLEPPNSREAADALRAKAFAKRGDFPRNDARVADGEARVTARAAVATASRADAGARTVSMPPRGPRGVLSTHARRRSAESSVAPANPSADETRFGTESASDARAALASASARTDPARVAAVRPTPFDASSGARSDAGRRTMRKDASSDARGSTKGSRGKTSIGEKDAAASRAASRDDVDARRLVDGGTSDDIETENFRTPLDKRTAFLAAALAEEESARSANRHTPDALEARFASELALFEEMGDIDAELDAARFARDAFDAEQAASRFAAVAERRRVELLGARQSLGAAREAADEALAVRDGRDADAAAFTEEDTAHVAERGAERGAGLAGVALETVPDSSESQDLDARPEARGARVARFEALVEKRRLNSLAPRTLAGKETTPREEMKRLDASVEKRTRRAAGKTPTEASSPFSPDAAPEVSTIPPASPAAADTRGAPRAAAVDPTAPTDVRAACRGDPVGFEALLRSATACRVDAATRAALDASGATARGLDRAAAAALESETALSAIQSAGSIESTRDRLLLKHGSAIDATAATEACVAATKTLTARLLRDTIVETVREAFPHVAETRLAGASFGSSFDPPAGRVGLSAQGAFAATSALAAAAGGGGLAGERLVDTIAARARAALTERAFSTSGAAAAEDDAAAEDAGGDAETPLDAIVRDDVLETDDLGWYAVRAVEKAIATRLSDEIFDELVADTVLALVGVGKTA